MSDLPLPDPTVVPTPAVLDIQHDTDPADDHGKAKRIPHMGHALLFFALVIFSTILVLLPVMVVVMRHGNADTLLRSPRLNGLVQMGGYALSLLVALPLFARVWQRSFWQGIHWNARPVMLHWGKLLLAAAGICAGGQLLAHFLPDGPQTDLLKLLDNPRDAWITAIFGALLVPIFEEICFRGFLLPAMATAYDWLSLDRTPAGLQRWEQSTAHTTGGLVFGAIVSSLAFAGIHAPQLHHVLGPVVALFLVSLALSAVRIRFQSVAASSLVHAAYNGILFTAMAVQTGGFLHLEKLASAK